MKTRDIIKYEDGDFTLTGKGDVWMTCEEIADLFGALAASVQRAARKVADAEKEKVKSLPLGNGYSIDAYNIEVIIALAHKFDTANTKMFRKWLAESLSAHWRGRKRCIIVDLRTGITY